MFLRSAFVVASILTIGGCASTPSPFIGGSGKYMQLSFGDTLVLQIDYPTPALCTENAKTITAAKRNDMQIVCSLESRHQHLSFDYEYVNVVTGEKVLSHLKTMESCDYFLGYAKKEPSNQAFKFSECKLTR